MKQPVYVIGNVTQPWQLPVQASKRNTRALFACKESILVVARPVAVQLRTARSCTNAAASICAPWMGANACSEGCSAVPLLGE